MTASEAACRFYGRKSRVDMDYMCELTGKTEEEIFADLKGVIFLNPMYGYGNSTQAKYLMADEYLSGNVREKLVLALKVGGALPRRLHRQCGSTGTGTAERPDRQRDRCSAWCYLAADRNCRTVYV